MRLAFPHISEEAAAHLFGIPHRHEHRARELGLKARRRSDSLHFAVCASARLRLGGPRESLTATGGVSPQPSALSPAMVGQSPALSVQLVSI